jgi:hypothetical protein
MSKIGVRKENGQGLVEYSMLLALLIINVILILLLTGVSVRDAYCKIVSALGGADACSRPSHLAFDDFATLNGWNKVIGNWQVANGLLYGGQGEGRAFMKNFTGTDYTVTADMATLTQGNGYGVFFRTSNEQAVNGYDFQYDPGYGQFVMRKWVGGYEISTPFARANPPANFAWLNTSRQVQVVVQGSTFTAYVDGQPVLTGTDSTYAQGGVGLRTWDSSNITVGSVTVDPPH